MCKLFEDFEVLFTEFGKKEEKTIQGRILFKEIKSGKFKIRHSFPFIIKMNFLIIIQIIF